jgi:hypothetical protein
MQVIAFEVFTVLIMSIILQRALVVCQGENGEIGVNLPLFGAGRPGGPLILTLLLRTFFASN